MKLIISLLAICSIALALLVTGCSGKGVAATQSTLPATSTSTSTQQADDVLPTPGGYAYRGNINQQGQTNPFSAHSGYRCGAQRRPCDLPGGYPDRDRANSPQYCGRLSDFNGQHATP